MAETYLFASVDHISFVLTELSAVELPRRAEEEDQELQGVPELRAGPLVLQSSVVNHDGRHTRALVGRVDPWCMAVT